MINNTITNHIIILWKERNKEWDEHLRTTHKNNQTAIDDLCAPFAQISFHTPPNTPQTITQITPTNITTNRQKRRRRRNTLISSSKHSNKNQPDLPPPPKKIKTSDTLSNKINKITSYTITYPTTSTQKRKKLTATIKLSKKQKTDITHFTQKITADIILPSYPPIATTISHIENSFGTVPPPPHKPPRLPSPPPFSPIGPYEPLSPIQTPQPQQNNTATYARRPRAEDTTNTPYNIITYDSDDPPSSPLIDNRKSKRQRTT